MIGDLSPKSRDLVFTHTNMVCVSVRTMVSDALMGFRDIPQR